MGCDEWLCWSGWTVIGTIAQVVSLVAIVFAIYELQERRRQVDPVVWGFDLFGSLDMNGHRYHAADFYNGGSGTAIITTMAFVNARPSPTNDHRFRSVMSSGDKVTVPLTSEQIGDAWLVVIWRASSDSRRIELEWLPVTRTGAMGNEWDKSLQRSRSRGPFAKMLPRRAPRPIGPGYYQNSSYRLSSSDEGDDGRFKVIWGGMDAIAPTMFPWSYSASAPTEDFPYVKL
jgi:hypothetical protein